jgi:hypothetical protein
MAVLAEDWADSTSVTAAPRASAKVPAVGVRLGAPGSSGRAMGWMAWAGMIMKSVGRRWKQSCGTQGPDEQAEAPVPHGRF